MAINLITVQEIIMVFGGRVLLVGFFVLMPWVNCFADGAGSVVSLLKGNRHFAAVSVANLQESAEWYKTLFGLSETFRYQSEQGEVKILVLANDALLIELQAHSAASVFPPTIEKRYLQHGIFKFGVFVEDLHQAMGIIEKRQVAVMVKPFEDQNSQTRTAIIVDRDGNMIQFFQPL